MCALQRLEARWKDEAGSRPPSQCTAKEAALAFRREVQSEPEIIGFKVATKWVEKTAYPLFCAAWSITDPPAWKDFAADLKWAMPKKRINNRKDGKRVGTARWYLVPDPSANVVRLTSRNAS